MTQMTSLARASSRAFAVAEPDAASDAIARLLGGRSLDRAGARALFTELVEGRLSDSLIAAMLVAIRLKGETADELIGAAEALLGAARRFDRPDGLFADSCGTGGDGSGSINVSTAAGLVAAACGLPIVKHGNRSVTSRCGSADVLEALGARLDCSPEQSRRAFDQTGFCFLLAPLYHPGLAHAGPVRRALGVRTVMNLLGPCVNPARPPVQLLGVAEAKLLRPVAETLAALGVERALVVHGGGLDEIALHSTTTAIRVVGGTLEVVELTPEQAGFERHPVERIAGGDPAENGARLAALLEGDGGVAETAIVALNAGALLWTAGLADSFAEGSAVASDALRAGTPARTLASFIEASRV